MKQPIALSFFSGALGLDLGLEKCGIKVILASEIDKSTCDTILSNRPGLCLVGDIRDYDSTSIRKLAGLGDVDEIDLVVGGPPCQAFSTAGKRRGFDDMRGNVFLTFIDRILGLRPKYAVIENVRGLLSAPFGGEKGGALSYVLKQLRGAGYGVSFNLYNAANFGAPQKRERVVIVCSRDGRKLPYLSPTNSETGGFGLPKWKTFEEATCDLNPVQHFVEFPPKRLRFYKMLMPGQCWRDLPDELQKEALGGAYYSKGGRTGFFRRLAWDAPAPTPVTHPAMPATDLAHPTADRPLSIEEYKRLQDFPDNWFVSGTLVDQYRQIGNAVPSSLGAAVGRLILADIGGYHKKDFPGFPYSRYKFTNDVNWWTGVT